MRLWAPTLLIRDGQLGKLERSGGPSSMLIEKNKSTKGGSLMNRRKFTIALGTATAGLVAGSALFGQDTTTTAKKTKKAKHDCQGKNACKGQGGCKTGDNGCSGKNSCKGKGGCAVPPKKS
jgi:hypothetical protein